MNTTVIAVRSARVGFAFFNRVVSVGFSVKVTFEQRLEGCGGEPYRDTEKGFSWKQEEPVILPML